MFFDSIIINELVITTKIFPYFGISSCPGGGSMFQRASVVQKVLLNLAS